MKVHNIDFYREWIEVEHNGEIIGCDLHSTNLLHLTKFYIDNKPYIYNEVTREIIEMAPGAASGKLVHAETAYGRTTTLSFGIKCF